MRAPYSIGHKMEASRFLSFFERPLKGKLARLGSATDNDVRR
jgi:hypothetical protein